MITFYLANKTPIRASIVMLVSFYGKKYRKGIGTGIPLKYWNQGKKRARTTADFNGNAVNYTIDLWANVGKQAVEHFTKLKHSPTPCEFASVLAELYTDVDIDGDAATSFCDYIANTYIPRYKRVRSVDTIKKYHTTLNKLRDFESHNRTKLRFDSINIDFYNTFQSWFFAAGYSANYFGNIIKIVKQIYREARDYDHLHNYNGISHRDFIATNEAADAVYLSIEELSQIESLKITPKLICEHGDPRTDENANRKVESLERTRSLFLIGCYTGLRVSDFSRLRDAHIGRHITIKTSKTGAGVVIPIHPVVKAILDNGFDLNTTISDQKFNEHIKDLCRLAGITQDVLLNKNIAGRPVEIITPKYKVISSHTARRSFATNAYKAGVPTIAIMKITGHTKESTFLRYIKMTAIENADTLSEHPFFAQKK